MRRGKCKTIGMVAAHNAKTTNKNYSIQSIIALIMTAIIRIVSKLTVDISLHLSYPERAIKVTLAHHSYVKRLS